MVELQGTTSNRDGIGASIRLQTAGGVQYNHHATSFGYASASAGPVHFGLGDEAEVELLEIRWPLGEVQTLRSVAADQVLAVTEP